MGKFEVSSKINKRNRKSMLEETAPRVQSMKEDSAPRVSDRLKLKTERSVIKSKEDDREALNDSR